MTDYSLAWDVISLHALLRPLKSTPILRKERARSLSHPFSTPGRKWPAFFHPPTLIALTLETVVIHPCYQWHRGSHAYFDKIPFFCTLITVKTLRDNNFQKEIFTCVLFYIHLRTATACHLPVWWQSGEMNSFCSINSLQTGIICVSTSVYSFLDIFSLPWQLPVMIFFFCQGYDRSQVKTKQRTGGKKI